MFYDHFTWGILGGDVGGIDTWFEKIYGSGRQYNLAEFPLFKISETYTKRSVDV